MKELRLFRVKAHWTRDVSIYIMATDSEKAKEQANNARLHDWQDDCEDEAFEIWDSELEERNMKRIKINDHQFAKLLRDNNAIDNYEHHGLTVKWFNSIGRLVCIAFYDNAKCVRQVFIPDYIKYVEDSNNETK